MPPAKPFILTLTQEAHPPTSLQLAAGTYRIGRDPDRAQIALLSGHVSRQHATLTLSIGEIRVVDGHSKNGIYVNGRRVAEAVLRPEDRLRIGDFTVEVAVRAPRRRPAAAVAQLGGEPTDPGDGELIDLGPAGPAAPSAGAGAWAGDGWEEVERDRLADNQEGSLQPDGDDDEGTEANFVAPYALSSLMLRDQRGVLAVHAPAATPRPFYVELIATSQTELVDFALLAPGGPGWHRIGPTTPSDEPGRGLVRVCPSRRGSCLVESDERLRGLLVRQRVEHDVADFFSEQKNHRFGGWMVPGDVLHLSYRQETFCLRYVDPPLPPPSRLGWKKRLRPSRRTAGSTSLVTLLTLSLLFGVSLPTPPPPPPPEPLEFVLASAEQLSRRPPQPAARRRAMTTPTPVAQVISETPAPVPQLAKTPSRKLTKQLSRQPPKRPRPAPPVARRRRTAVGVLGARGTTGSTQAGGKPTLLPSTRTLQAVLSPAPHPSFVMSGLLAHPAQPSEVRLGGGSDAVPSPAPSLGGEAGGASGRPADDGPGAVQRSGTGVEVRGGALDMASIMRVILAHTAALQACYESGLQRNHQMAGRVRVGWIIDLDGSVRAAHILRSALDTAADACVVDEVASWQFPLPHGSPVEVEFPFVTKSVDF